MGNSRWDDNSYRSLAASTGRATMSKAQLFQSRSLDPLLDPMKLLVGKGERKGQKLRESIISEENPNPTPIILALDVTGSMGEVAAQIARDELPKLMTEIHSKGVVSDPHVMFMGFDDVHVQGHGALQMSYFEPDLRIVEQLNKLWLVNNGGGNGSESYDLPWYAAAHYTYLQGYDKQGRKGFLFTFGDEPVPYETMTPEELTSVFGPGDYENTPPEASLKMAQQRYQVFHICVEGHSRSLADGWTKLLGPNALFVNRGEVQYLTDIVIATMAIANGQDIHEYIATQKSGVKEALKNAFRNTLKG